MKYLVTFGILCLVAYSTQVPRFDNCDEETKKQFDNESCLDVSCKSFKNETHSDFNLVALSCLPVKCEKGEYKGQTKYEFTKVYPDCCPKPICE